MAAIPAADAAQPSLLTFIFGDSLTEVGNNNFLQYSLAKSNYPWYGIDYKGGQATGRFTNGRTIGDIISSKLGIPSPPPFLSLSKAEDAILKGANYASGGAGILNETGLYFIQRLTFDDQINAFDKTKQAVKAKLGGVAADKLFNEAVFFIGIDAQQYTPEEFVELLVSTLDHQLSRLYLLGARKMMFHGLGPLGCIPSQRVKSKRGECLKQVNRWVLQFNSKVKNLLISLKRRLPTAQLTFVDTYHDVLDLINNPGASCCNVASLGGLCLPNSKLCKNRTEFVFWDAFHPSDAANAVLADRIFSTVFSQSHSPSPAPSSGGRPHHPHH